MLLTAAIVLFVLWLLGVTLFKITKGVIHIVLVIAIIAVIAYFMGVAR